MIQDSPVSHNLMNVFLWYITLIKVSGLSIGVLIFWELKLVEKFILTVLTVCAEFPLTQCFASKFINRPYIQDVLFCGMFRRSYGRPPKTVKLKAHFVRFSQDLLVDVCNLEMYQSASSLHRRPFLHIYWTDCQVRELSRYRRYQTSYWCRMVLRCGSEAQSQLAYCPTITKLGNLS